MDSITNIHSTTTNVQSNKSLKEKYLDFCDGQSNYAIVWYAIPALALASGVFPTAFFVLFLASKLSVAYMTFTGVSLYANIIPNMIGLSTRYTISIFVLTILIHLIAVAAILIF